MTFWFHALTFSMLVLLPSVWGHGRLMDPPSRSSMWRVGFNTTHNYNDNALNCGGYSNEWYVMHGKCGICGDPWQDPTPRNNEAGGLYGKGIITKTYSTGQEIKILVQVTANHGGWFEFRLCANNDPTKVITRSCLDQHLLQLREGGTRHHLTGTESDVIVTAKLPAGLTCTQCVLQWKWNAGNSFGIDPDGKGCVGCGHQEEFYGCSDIAIGSTTNPRLSTTAGNRPPSTIQPQTYPPIISRQPQTYPPIISRLPPTVLPPVVSTKRQPLPLTSSAVYTNPPNPSTIGQNSGLCHGVNLWQGKPVLDQWCAVNCPKGLCPPVYCTCSKSPSKPQTSNPVPPQTYHPVPPQTYHPLPQTSPPLPPQTFRPLPPQTFRPLPPQTSYPVPPQTRYPIAFKPTTQLPVVPHSQSPPRPVVPTGYPPIQTNLPPQMQTTNTNNHPSGQTAKLRQCHGVHLWQGVAILDQWCTVNCAKGLCPPMYCDCSGVVQAYSLSTKPAAPIYKTTITKPKLPQTPSNTTPGALIWQTSRRSSTKQTMLPTQKSTLPTQKSTLPFLLTKTTTQVQLTSSAGSNGGPCRAINNLQGIAIYDQFCNSVCNNSNSTCPPLLCECKTKP